MNAAAPTIILQARNIQKHFGGVKALSGINFSLHANELRCLIGPNGAGKSTFFKVLSGQIPASSGDILFEGRSITRTAQHVIARQGMGIKNQVPTVMDGLSVNENLWLAARSVMSPEAAHACAAQLAQRLELQTVTHKLVGELAHGQRQWVEIGMVIARDPKVILFDEPAAGMSDAETDQMVALIRELNTRAAIVVVEHDMAFIGKIAQQVTVFHQGKILMEDTFSAVVASPQVRDVYLGRGRDA